MATVNQLDTILKDADSLLKSCGTDYDDITEYQLLVRCLSEQTVVEEASRRLRTKGDGGFQVSVLHPPHCPRLAAFPSCWSSFQEAVGCVQHGFLLSSLLSY